MDTVLLKDILEKLDAVNRENAYLKNVLDTMEKLPADGNPEIINQKIVSLEHIVSCRETTNQQLIAAYTKALQMISETK